MTLPFENDTSAIVRKLANRSIKADKRSKMFLLLTIALSVCMIFSIILISAGTEEKYKNTQRNRAQIGVLGITDEQADLLLKKSGVLCKTRNATAYIQYPPHNLLFRDCG